MFSVFCADHRALPLICILDMPINGNTCRLLASITGAKLSWPDTICSLTCMIVALVHGLSIHEFTRLLPSYSPYCSEEILRLHLCAHLCLEMRISADLVHKSAIYPQPFFQPLLLHLKCHLAVEPASHIRASTHANTT